MKAVVAYVMVLTQHSLRESDAKHDHPVALLRKKNAVHFP